MSPLGSPTAAATSAGNGVAAETALLAWLLVIVLVVAAPESWRLVHDRFLAAASAAGVS